MKRTHQVLIACFTILMIALLIWWIKTKPTPQAGLSGTPVKRKYVIGYQETALYRHLFTAKEKGFFEQEGIQVEVKSFVSANRMIEGMVAGQLDGSGLTNLQVALTVEAKDPGQVKLVNFLIWREKSFPDYILVRHDSGIKSVKEIEGHTIGLHPGSAVKAFCKSVLKHFGSNSDKVKLLELEPGIMQSAVVAKRLDALYCMDPVATNLLESRECSVLVANPMQYIFESPVPISGTALSGKFIRENPTDAQKVSRALEKAINYMREPGHEDEIAGYIARYTPISKEIALKMNISEYWTLSEIDRTRVQALANRFQELGIVEKHVDVNSFISPANFLSNGGEGNK